MDFYMKVEKLTTWFMEQKIVDYYRLTNILNILIDADTYILNSSRFVIAQTGKQDVADYRFFYELDKKIEEIKIPTLLDYDDKKLAIVPIYYNTHNLGYIATEKEPTKDDIALLQIAAMIIGRDKLHSLDQHTIEHYKYCEEELKRQKEEFNRRELSLKELYQKRISELNKKFKVKKEKKEMTSEDRCSIALAALQPIELLCIKATMKQLYNDEGIIDTHETARSVNSVSTTLKHGLSRLKRAGILETDRKTGSHLYIKILDNNFMKALKEHQA